MPRAAREADEPLGVLGDDLDRGRRRQRLARLAPRRSRAARGVGEDPAEVRVAALALAEQRDVRAARERDLGAGDRAEPEELRGVRELERAVDPVVVGERERVVAELDRARGELLRQRGAVEERVRRVGVQLDVRPAAPAPGCGGASGSRSARTAASPSLAPTLPGTGPEGRGKPVTVCHGSAPIVCRFPAAGSGRRARPARAAEREPDVRHTIASWTASAFEELCDDLLVRNADLERTKMMGMPSLKRNGKLVAGFAAAEDAMVFKLADPGCARRGARARRARTSSIPAVAAGR